MHFIPSPWFRWGAFLAAVVHCAIIFALGLKIRRAKPPQEKYDELWPFKLALGVVMGVYFSYVSFYVTVPALLTEAIGVPATQEFVIVGLKKGSARAVLCPYRLRLAHATTVLDDTFCVSKAFARQHSAGQSIQLTGKQSRFGFRFTNA